MTNLKNQNLLHLASSDGKKTKCGLSNQYKDAYSKDVFDIKMSNNLLSKFCCKKCQN